MQAYKSGGRACMPVVAGVAFLAAASAVGAALALDRAAPGDAAAATHVARLTVTAATADHVAFTVNVNDVALSEASTRGGPYTVVTCDGARPAGAVGEPSLPVVRRLVLVPEGATPVVSVQASEPVFRSLSGQGLVNPVAPMQPVSLVSPDGVQLEPFAFDPDAYAQDAFGPEARVAATEAGTARRQRLWLLEVRPVAYNPARHELALYQQIDVSVRFDGGTGVYHGLGQMGGLNDVVLNPQPTHTFGRGSGNYLVVAAEAYATSAPMTEFIDGKTAQGFDVSLYSVPPGTAGATIRDYIASLWDTPDAPDYLLLVGDTDTIPHFNGQGRGAGPTDLPYACMDEGDDWMPDIFRGRFSVRSVDDLQAIVDKSLSVDAGDFADPAYATRALFMAGWDTESGDEATHEYVIENYLEPAGIASRRLYCRTYGATTEDVRTALNDGCAYASFYGHSYGDQWQNGPAFSKDDVSGLNNERLYPVVFNFTCSIGCYPFVTCYCEHWHREAGRGAAATIGNSNYIYYQDNPGWPETSDLEKFIFQSIFEDGIEELAPAWDAAMLRELAAWGSTHDVRGYFEMFNLLGDPALVLPRTPSENYLIVTPADFAASAPLTQFASAKTAQGYDVMIYEVPDGTSREDIRTHIRDLWGTPDAPDYILIVGDTSGASATSDTIPHWVGQGSRGATTDLPYACMDDGDDWYPEVPIGRFSAASESQLQAMVDKSLFVEAGLFDDPEYTRRAAMLATGDDTAEADVLHTIMINTYLTPAGFDATKIYADLGGGSADITAAVNAGALFTVYFGHSGSSGWSSPSFNQSNVRALSNEGLYGLVFGFSCNTAHFDYDECFGETWVREANKGAAAYLSASNYVWWGSYEAWESSRRMEDYFLRSFFGDGIWKVGPAWQAALYRLLEDPDFGPTHDHTRNIFEEFVLLGDPSLELPGPAGFSIAANPTSRDACFPPDVEVVYTIQVLNQGDFDEEVTLSAAGGPTAARYAFDVNSQVPPFTSTLTVWNLDDAVPGQYTITVTGASVSHQRAVAVELNHSREAPGVATLITPADGATDVQRSPTLTWSEVPAAFEYDVEIATDAAFGSVVYTATAAGTSHTVDAYLDPVDTYYWHVRAVNGCGPGEYSETFSFTTIDQPDYFTEQFSGSDAFDMQYFSVTFVPSEYGSYYEACGGKATELPVDPAAGTPLTLADDGSTRLDVTQSVWLYNVSYDSFYVNANGNLTFEAGDGTYSQSLEAHFDQPRISAFFRDLNPESGGTISWQETTEEVVVTWDDVPQWGTANSHTFQIELFFDGTLRITWLRMDASDAIVGLSQGGGVPVDFLEYDLSAVTECISGPQEAGCLIISEVVAATLSGGCPKWIEITNTGLNNYTFTEGGLIVQEDSRTDVTVDVDLTGVTIPAGTSFTINANESGSCTGAFPFIYAQEADLYTEIFFGDGNDRYILTDTADGSNLLDIYGEFGVDGRDTVWEYTLGYSYRLSVCNHGNGGDFIPGEWFFGGPGSLDVPDPEQMLLDSTSPGEHAYDASCTDVDPAILTAAASAALHAPAGGYPGGAPALPIDLERGTVEPRETEAGEAWLVLTFDRDVNVDLLLATIVPDPGVGFSLSPGAAANEVELHFDDSVPRDKYQVSVVGDGVGTFPLCYVPGDVNCSGDATGLDLAAIQSPANWNHDLSEGADPRADINRDGQVSGLDLAKVQSPANWNQPVPALDCGCPGS